MDIEINSLLDNETWKLVDTLDIYKPISCEWVFKIKYDN